MIVNRALFKNGNAEEIITLESIAHHEDYLFVKDHLYCVTQGCKCRILFIPKGIKTAYFKKWNGDQHHKECPYYVESLEGSKARRIVEQKVTMLSDSHISKILKDTFRRFHETEEERNHRLKMQKINSRVRKTLLVGNQARENPEDVIVTIPTTSLEGTRVRYGEKSPKVPKRLSIIHFRISDIGQTLSTIGLLKRIYISENLSILTITDVNERLEFQIILEETFYENSFININASLEELNLLLSQGKQLIVTCLGEVFGENGDFGMHILDDKKLTFNGVNLREFLTIET